LREKWPWNREYLRLFLIIPSLIGIAAAVALYPVGGAQALWFLTGVPMGGGFYLVYGFVGRRVNALKDQFKEGPNEWAEGLLVINKIECPGLVILRSSELEWVPIVGERCILPFSKIIFYKEGHWLPEKYVWGKRAFNFHTLTHKRLAFAVPESIGARWSVLLRNRKVK